MWSTASCGVTSSTFLDPSGPPATPVPLVQQLCLLNPYLNRLEPDHQLPGPGSVPAVSSSSSEPSSSLQRGGASLQPTPGENVWNSVSALGSGRWFFFSTWLSKPTFISTTTRTVLSQLSRIKYSLRRWRLRLRSLRPLRSLRHPNLRLPERKMTLSWENLVELWREGKRLKKVNS